MGWGVWNVNNFDRAACLEGFEPPTCGSEVSFFIVFIIGSPHDRFNPPVSRLLANH